MLSYFNIKLCILQDLEIERLTGSLDAKDNIITEMENQQEKLIEEAV